jgi:DNA invertase Pin-like site-specific DNA recombinase
MQYVSYIRVSGSQKQRESGLGLEAQTAAIQRFIKPDDEIMASFCEIETATGKRHRPELQSALELCRKNGYTLLVLRSDRLTRSMSFLMALFESKPKVNFICIDNPHATPFFLTLLTAFSAEEARLIAERTRAALQAAKARGQRLGNPSPENALKQAIQANKHKADTFAARLLPVIREIQDKAGVHTLQGISDALNARGFKTRTNRPFVPNLVRNILLRNNLQT